MRQVLVAVLALTLCANSFAGEKEAMKAFDRAKRTEPELLAFLKKMPKGGDLHNHMSGAAYADYMLDAAIAKGLYFNPDTAQFTTDSTKVPAQSLLSNNKLLYSFMNAASMRGWTGAAQTGHDHFFETFGIFGGALNAMNIDDVFVQVIGRAKAQNLQYMELMAGVAPDSANAEYGRDIPSSTDMEAAFAVLLPRLPKLLAAVKPNLDAREGLGRRLGQKSLSGSGNPITIRYVYSIYRLASDDSFFASAAAGMYLAKHEPRVAAMNMVAPEDHPLSRTHFQRQMAMLDFLWKKLGKPNLTLHAGELTTAISPPEPMRNRIRQTFEIGHARRIGHGVSIAFEDNVDELLAKMRREGIAVEICLSSNASILGVSGEQHPLRLYRSRGVPVFLNTDDEGVSRTTMTQEWVRAVRDQKMSYSDLKEMARNSIEYSFLPGQSLYFDRNYAHLAKGFEKARSPQWTPSREVERLLAGSQKMQVQLRLERGLVAFEGSYHS